MSGLAAFINGGISGVNMRHDWDDRKRRQEIEDEQLGWDREDRTYDMGQRERTLGIQQREDADAARMRTLLEQGNTDVNAAMYGTGQPQRTVMPDATPIVETTLPPVNQNSDTPEQVAYDTAMALQNTPINGQAAAANVDPNSGFVPDYMGVQHAPPQAEQDAITARNEEMRVAAANSRPRELSVMDASAQQPTGGVTPSVEIATAAAQEATPNVQRGAANASNTPAMAERAERSFLQNWNDIVAPRIIEERLRSGDIAGARRLEEFIQEDAVQEGISTWSKAVFAAHIGDEEATLDYMAQTYNNQGYFDDGYALDRAQSGFDRDEQGNISGVHLAFRNEQTGEVSVQQLDGMNDLIEIGIGMLDPNQVLNQAIADRDAATSARADEMTHQRRMELEVLKQTGRADAPSDEITRDDISDAMKELADLALGGAGAVDDQGRSFSELSQKEQIEMAIAYIQAQNQAMAQGIASLGTGAPAASPPVWTGN